MFRKRNVINSTESTPLIEEQPADDEIPPDNIKGLFI